MRFLFTQIVIVILVCVFFSALSNLTELGIVGWLAVISSGYALYRIYRNIQNSFKSERRRRDPGLSGTLEAFMFDDATENRTE